MVGKRLIAVRLACFSASYERIVQTIISAVRVTNRHKHGRAVWVKYNGRSSTEIELQYK